MKTKIYSHHLCEANLVDDDKPPDLFDFTAKPKGTEFIFHSENCFSVKNEKAEYTWWGADFLKYNQEIDTQNYFMYNSGFFIINNLQAVKPIFDRVISYRQFSTHTGDQPFLNLALYNSHLEILGINKNDGLSFSRSITQSFDALNQIWVHFNSGVGNLSKLNLMKSFYTKLAN